MIRVILTQKKRTASSFINFTAAYSGAESFTNTMNEIRNNSMSSRIAPEIKSDISLKESQNNSSEKFELTTAAKESHFLQSSKKTQSFQERKFAEVSDLKPASSISRREFPTASGKKFQMNSQNLSSYNSRIAHVNRSEHAIPQSATEPRIAMEQQHLKCSKKHHTTCEKVLDVRNESQNTFIQKIQYPSPQKPESTNLKVAQIEKEEKIEKFPPVLTNESTGFKTDKRQIGRSIESEGSAVSESMIASCSSKQIHEIIVQDSEAIQ